VSRLVGSEMCIRDRNYAEEMGLVTGDPVDLSFADLYQRYLEKQRVITIKKPGGVTEEYRLTDQDLGPALTEQFNAIKDFIDDAGFGSAPISPIDYIHNELNKANYKTEEITGRTITLNYSSVAQPKAQEETKFSFETTEQGSDKTAWYSKYARSKSYKGNLSQEFSIGKIIGFDKREPDTHVIVGKLKVDKTNDALYFVAQNLKTKELSIGTPPMTWSSGKDTKVDKDYQSELNAFHPAKKLTAGPLLTSRSANIKQRVNAVKNFNSGKADVIILNQAGSTGLSLHASEKVSDKRKRHMIIIQPEKNIDTHMQMLGRVHRTGQVITPAYSQMMADIPAEMRPAAVLLKKMASLNANTTGSRKSAVSAEGAVDFMNDYGGQVAQEYLRDNPEVYEDLGGKRIISLVDDPTEANEDDIRKLTGYIPILPIKQQEEIYKDLVERYNDLVTREESMGTNKLEAKAADLDAKTISSEPVSYTHLTLPTSP
jgi:hypothetical protein